MEKVTATIFAADTIVYDGVTASIDVRDPVTDWGGSFNLPGDQPFDSSRFAGVSCSLKTSDGRGGRIGILLSMGGSAVSFTGLGPFGPVQ